MSWSLRFTARWATVGLGVILAATVVIEVLG